MIHILLNLTRPLFVIDTETTGLNVDEARIVELGLQHWTSDGLAREWRSWINPCMPIPDAASAVHGITNERMHACRRCGYPYATLGHEDGTCQYYGWPTFRQLAESLAHGLTDCDFAGKNPRFDLRVLAAEFTRAGVPWSYAGARIIDIDRLEAIANPRDLTSLYKKYLGVDHDDAHGALADVRASTLVLIAQLIDHAVLPRSLDALHERSWPGWLTTDGSIRLVNGVPTVMFGKHRDKPVADVPMDYWDWILGPKANFGAEMKSVAARIKLGTFP